MDFSLAPLNLHQLLFRTDPLCHYNSLASLAYTLLRQTLTKLTAPYWNP